MSRFSVCGSHWVSVWSDLDQIRIKIGQLVLRHENCLLCHTRQTHGLAICRRIEPYAPSMSDTQSLRGQEEDVLHAAFQPWLTYNNGANKHHVRCMDNRTTLPASLMPCSYWSPIAWLSPTALCITAFFMEPQNHDFSFLTYLEKSGVFVISG
ncbi:hypothetical protein VFPPC_16953 [Pochonia chlamydosporia 170]|uniref:Uncharacterized protein n=1 Tax=Pochonia chlamydosporia 170 TaxID=1380566 RepID=A0A179F0Z5_METCM|nr:hypothetical protein VFPPC_16953 [Pochonia chlamydosporia 170]OAQ58753.1 hypothetical protein VFPPC_16953 [Pochonia chlamydosporia 170]